MNGVDVCFCADVHVGNPRAFGGPMASGVNARGRHVLDALRAAVADAVASSSDALVVLGDLFDSSRATPQLIAAVMEVLTTAAENGVPVHLLLGNHDQESADEGDHALAPLAMVEGVTVHERPAVVSVRRDAEVWMVPFQVGRASEWLPGVLERLSAGSPPEARVALALHLGVIDGETLPFLRESPDAIDLRLLRALCSQYRIGHVFCGNWHDRRVWEGPEGAKVVQVGALAPTGFNNPGHEGYGMAEHWNGGDN
jgi:DNA repair exonuclease SbcCD nuclease subunit